MKWFESRILWGLLLILGGVLFLIENMGILEISGLFWALLLGVAGAAFISIYFSNQSNWWALIPGVVLVSLALNIALSVTFPGISNVAGGLIVLGGIGLAFLAVYLTNRNNWWAIIPAGVMFTLGIISVLDETTFGLETGGILFIGIGLTFAVLTILPTPGGRLGWAIFPAAVLVVFGLLVMAAAGAWINYLWPAVLILVGLFLIIRNFAYRRDKPL